MSEFQPFEMERMMSKFEQDVDYNLSESGVHPVTLRELLGDVQQAIDALLETELNYPCANGTPALRENIAATYNGATADNVLVTVGAIEANYLAIETLLDPGDEIVVMLPNYMQIWGISKNHNLNLKTFNLREDRGWAPDLNELEDRVSSKTKLIAVCNPDNPTGRIFTREEMQAIVQIAERSGAWILADEVYRGAERLSDEVAPSFYGEYDKVIATGSMSKAYGLPGLRIGWAAAPAKIIEALWARHEYIAISATMLSNHLAAIALEPTKRQQLLARTRKFIREGYPVLEQWAQSHGSVFSLTPPDASAIAFIHYDLPINSTRLMEKIRTEGSVLIVPGDQFGLDHYLRISFGLPHDYLRAGLDRIHKVVAGIQSEAA